MVLIRIKNSSSPFFYIDQTDVLSEMVCFLSNNNLRSIWDHSTWLGGAIVFEGTVNTEYFVGMLFSYILYATASVRKK